MIKKGIFYFLFLTIFLQISVRAQTATPSDSLRYAFLPALAYNSDLGIVFGGVLSRYDYKSDLKPFYSFTNISGVFSTKGLASFDVAVDKPQVFGTDMRLSTNAYISRFLQNSYFGIANYDKIDSYTQESVQFYEFQSFSAGLYATLRIPILRSAKSNQLDAMAILNLDYETPWDNGSDRLITLENPPGYDGGRSFMIGSGLIWEGRNSEFAPTTGTYLESSLEVGNKLWGSSFNNLILKHDMRHYFTFHLIRDITFANRFFLKHSAGDTPYWKLAYAGDEETLRGYPSRRFLDDNVVILNNELRTWLFDFPSIDTRFGGTIFMDIGRTFSNGSSIDAITNDLKYTYGFGGTSSFFTPDFIIRMDIGFSDEDTGVYISIGYMF